MAFYTKKGDDGTTKTLRDNKRISKKALIAEALGSVDETNSLIGLCKMKAYNSGFKFSKRSVADILHTVQNNLFTIQAIIAGAGKLLSGNKVVEMEDLINRIEKSMPAVNSFCVPGGTELSALFDFARAVSRRAERTVVKANDENKLGLDKRALSYLNRLSSLMYALARLANHSSGINEEPPKYE